jgi:lysozyme family protein
MQEQALGSVKFLTYASQTIAFETGGDKSGAYHKDPNDSGGETKWGISKRAHPNENIKALTYNDALRIYQVQYWNRLYDYIEDNRIAFKLYDMGVLMGVKTAVKILQRILKKYVTLKVDGIFGNMTLTAVQTAGNRDEVYNEYVVALERYFRSIAFWNPKNKKFLGGWLRRLNWVWGGENAKW